MPKSFIMSDINSLITEPRLQPAPDIFIDLDLDTPLNLSNVDEEPETKKAEVIITRKDNLQIRRTPASKIFPKRQTWLFRPFIPASAVTLLAGLPSMGKSKLIIAIATAITRQIRLPFQTEPMPKGDVIFFDAEQSIHHIMIPDLIAAGADMDHVHFIDIEQLREIKTPTGIVQTVETRSFRFKEHLKHLRDQILDIGTVSLVHFDPITAYLGKDVNSASTEAIRDTLGPLVLLAEECKISIVMTTHLNKDVMNIDFISRILGSNAFAALPRSVIGLVSHPEDPNLRLLGVAKSNILAPEDKFLIPYELVSKTIELTEEDGTRYHHTTGVIKLYEERITDISIDDSLRAERAKQETKYEGKEGGSTSAQAEILDIMSKCNSPLKERDIILMCCPDDRENKDFLHSKKYEKYHTAFRRMKKTKIIIEDEKHKSLFYLAKFKLSETGKLIKE